MARPHIEDGETDLQTWRVAANILNKQYGQEPICEPPALCLGEVLTNSRLKELECYRIFHNGLVRAVLNKVMDRRVQQDPWNSSIT
jgi:hypothetical protein